MARVLSLQSLVAYGHVGNRVAVLVLERLGVEVVAVPTAILSNHTGHPTAARTSFGAADADRLLEGLEELGVLTGLDAILVGYTGSAGAVATAARAIDRARDSAAGLVVVVDPAMGDEKGGMFVPDEVADAVAALLVPRATVLVPNRYECALLAGLVAGRAPGGGGIATPVEAAEALRAAGPASVVLTSAGDDPDEVAVVVVDEEGAAVIATPRLPVAVGGAGDLLAAVLTVGIVEGRSVRAAARAAVDATAAVLAATVARGGRELALVAAQDALADPPRASRLSVLGTRS